MFFIWCRNFMAKRRAPKVFRMVVILAFVELNEEDHKTPRNPEGTSVENFLKVFVAGQNSWKTSRIRKKHEIASGLKNLCAYFIRGTPIYPG